MIRNRNCLFRTIFLVIATAIAVSIATAQTTATLAARPPMGWNSWNHFAEKVTDSDLRATADALVSSGMRATGYLYVNVDDTWEGQRDAAGNIHANSKFRDKFDRRIACDVQDATSHRMPPPSSHVMSALREIYSLSVH